MSRREDLFFELLQVALGNREQLSCVPSAAEWADLYDEAERQAILGVLLEGLERLPAEQLPPVPMKLQWIGMAQMIEAECRLHIGRARELTDRFRAVGFRSCVLKGIGMAQLYANPLRRQCGDIDLWVSGRRKDVMLYLRSEYAIEGIRWHHADAKVFDDVVTEIHFHATWLFNPIHNRRLQKWLDSNGLPQAFETDKGFNVPTLKFDAVYALVHAFHHLLETGIGLRHMVDYYYVIKALPAENRDEVVRMVELVGLRSFWEP